MSHDTAAGDATAPGDETLTAARWFDDLPENTRDRDVLRRWRTRRFGD